MDAIVEKLNRKQRRLWNASGRGAKTARDLINALYGATFDGKAVYSALAVYLFSFSTHAEDTEFDREHGIRSQWDNYTGPEGYCLVFDIDELSRMLGQEMDARYWARLTLDPVRYADQPIQDIFPELVYASADTLQQFINGVKLPEMAVPEFLAGATLLKGAAYKSEREIRIVAIPGTIKTAKYAAKEYPDQFDATAPLPEIRTRPDSSKRYIALFDGLGVRLPIKRVIVGPGARHAGRAGALNARRSTNHDLPLLIAIAHRFRDRSRAMWYERQANTCAFRVASVSHGIAVNARKSLTCFGFALRSFATRTGLAAGGRKCKRRWTSIEAQREPIPARRSSLRAGVENR